MMVQETYKTTWLAKAPEYWNTLRIKNIFAEIDERSETGQEELLSVSHYTGVTKKRDSLENETDFISNAKTLVGYKKVAENDLVSNIMLAWNGSLGISKYNGITSPAYCVYRIKGDNNPNYYGYLFSTAFMKAEFRKKSFGIIDSRLRLYSDKFFSIPAPVPPKAEQDQIVAYIKEQSKKIKHFIKKKQTFIDLLKEQRQAVINKAVTKGVNPNVKLKDSGIVWLGEMPENWERTALKRLVSTKITDGPHETPNFVDEGVPFVSAEAAYGGRICLDRKRGFISPELHKEYSKKVLPKFGDIFIVKSGSTTGKTVIVDIKDEFNIWSPLALVRTNELINNEFMLYALQSGYFQHQVQQNWSFGTQPNIGMKVLEKLFIKFPKDIEEQKKIVSKIKIETAKIDQAITKAQKEIELIKEYKEAMIAEVVLGKFNHKIEKE